MTNGFDKLLRESLEARGASDAGECVDAALLAAWFDGTLSHTERTAVEAHAASCSRCQAMIAALVRTDRPAPRRAWHVPAMRWLVPLTVAAAASLVLWISVSPARRTAVPAATTARLEAPGAPTPESARSADARQSAIAAGPAAELSRELPSTSERAPAADAKQTDAKQTDAKQTDAKHGGAKQAGERQESRADADPRLRQAEAAPVLAPRAEPLKEQAAGAPAPAAPAASPPPPPTPAPERAMANASAVPGKPAGQMTDAAASATAPATQANITTADAADRPVARRLAESVATTAGRAGSGGIVVFISPDRSVQWRLTGSQVQRSNDGMTWQTQTTGVSEALMAGVAPSRSVCWLVGRRGVVMRTSDSGQTWERVAFPEELDLVNVAAGDDKVATVTAASGRQLHTTDGGKSWR